MNYVKYLKDKEYVGGDHKITDDQRRTGRAVTIGMICNIRFPNYFPVRTIKGKQLGIQCRHEKAVAMNGDSEDDEDDAFSSESRTRTIASLRSQLAQAIEDKNHAEKSRDSLQDELERVKTVNAIELSELNEQVGEMRLEAHQLEMQLDEALVQRT